jgi:virginiamycin B lyase
MNKRKRGVALVVIAIAGIFVSSEISRANDSASDKHGPAWYSKPTCQTQHGKRICIFDGPPGASGALRIAGGLSKDLWFGSSSLNAVVRFTTKGVATTYPIPTQSAGPDGIALGPDKRMWFNEWQAGNVGAINANGKISEYALGFSPSESVEMILGPDNNVWLPTDANGIVKVTPKGSVTRYNLPKGGNASQPTALTVGADKNIWFYEWFGPCAGGSFTGIGKITKTGRVTYYPVGQNGNGFGIASGPDKRIWFADPGGCNGSTARVGAIKTDGSGLVYYTKGVPPLVDEIINGGDGNLYFGTFTSQIGRITPSGKVTVWNLPSNPVFPVLGMTVGPDHNIWFVDNSNNRVGVLHLK